MELILEAKLYFLELIFFQCDQILILGGIYTGNLALHNVAIAANSSIETSRV